MPPQDLDRTWHTEDKGGLVEKNLPANAGDMDSIPALGRSPGEENGNPLQDSGLGNPMDEVWVQSMGSPRVRHN